VVLAGRQRPRRDDRHRGHGHLCVGHLASGATWFESRADYASFAWAPDGSCLVAIEHDRVSLVDARDGTARTTVVMPEDDYPRALAWTADGTAIVVLASHGEDNKTTTFAVLDRETLAIRARHDLGIEMYGANLVAAPDGDILTIVDRKIIRFAPKTGRHEVTKIAGRIEKGAYLRSLVGPRVALFVGDAAAFLVDLAGAKVARKLPPDAKLVAASADGAVVATAHGVTVQLWTAELEPRASDPGLTTKLNAIAFSAMARRSSPPTRPASVRGTPAAPRSPRSRSARCRPDRGRFPRARRARWQDVRGRVAGWQGGTTVDHAYHWGRLSPTEPRS